MSKRLMFVISSLSAGGAERVASILVNAWAAACDEVTLVTIASARNDFYSIDSAVRRIAFDLLANSANLRESLEQNRKRIICLRRAFRACRPDVVVSFLEKSNILVLLASLGLGVPVIVSERTDPRYYPAGALTSCLRRITYPLARALVVQTQEVGRWARQIVGGGNVYVIPNPVVLPPVRGRTEKLLKKDHTVLAIGRMRPEKGFDLLLQAFAQCCGRHPDWNLRIVGDGPERARLSALANKLGIERRLQLDGIVKLPQSVLQAADLFVLSSRFEGFPNVLLEAMACGLAVMSFDCPSGPRAIIQNGVDGILVPPGDVQALADTMDKLMGDDSERCRLGTNALEVTERFSVPRIMAMWDKVLSRATRGTCMGSA